MRHCSDTDINVKIEKERKTDSVELDDDSAPDNMHTGCGFGRFRPKFLQICANPIVFMIILITYCCLEGAIASGESWRQYDID